MPQDKKSATYRASTAPMCSDRPYRAPTAHMYGPKTYRAPTAKTTGTSSGSSTSKGYRAPEAKM